MHEVRISKGPSSFFNNHLKAPTVVGAFLIFWSVRVPGAKAPGYKTNVIITQKKQTSVMQRSRGIGIAAAKNYGSFKDKISLLNDGPIDPSCVGMTARVSG